VKYEAKRAHFCSAALLPAAILLFCSQSTTALLPMRRCPGHNRAGRRADEERRAKMFFQSMVGRIYLRTCVCRGSRPGGPEGPFGGGGGGSNSGSCGGGGGKQSDGSGGSSSTSGGAAKRIDWNLELARGCHFKARGYISIGALLSLRFAVCCVMSHWLSFALPAWVPHISPWFPTRSTWSCLSVCRCPLAGLPSAVVRPY
jgi:hypothetical protein